MICMNKKASTTALQYIGYGRELTDVVNLYEHELQLQDESISNLMNIADMQRMQLGECVGLVAIKDAEIETCDKQNIIAGNQNKHYRKKLRGKNWIIAGMSAALLTTIMISAK